ncbi:MAG: SWIM zinc finger family protein [Oscillospiraceae bacterium]|nr:SWIM zinc finger family protein [Oscillospiraceae bacterium]
MNLKNFEENFDKTILQRGKNYYHDGAVLSIEKIFENEYTAEVEGYALYNVTVEMDDNGNIDDITCDCPYDMGEYCKHEAAVLYALRDSTVKTGKSNVKKSDLPQLLGKCSDTQLVEIILEHAKEDKSFGNYLCMKLSENSDSNSIVSDFRHISDIYFKGRSDVNDVLKAGRLLVDKTEKLNSSIDKIRIYTEVISILEHGIENSYDYDYDEESWELFETINDCSSLMETAVTNIADSKNEADIESAWECILQYWHGSFQIDGEEHFFPSLLQLCRFPEYRSKLDEMLAFRQVSAGEYRKKEIDNQRFSIIQNYGTENEITDYINSHIGNPDFCRLAIERAIHEKNYTKAEQLALEGAASDKSHFSSVSSWHYLLHDIYKLSGNAKKLTDICYNMVKYGKTDYYEEWKSLIPEGNRSDEINRLLNESENYSYEYIVSHENMSERIYQLCCKFPSKISCYYEKLKTTEFREQSKNLYEQYIRYEGSQASNRSEYAALCRQLKKFSMECDAELAITIAADFRQLYRRKPAFMDELTKSGF